MQTNILEKEGQNGDGLNWNIIVIAGYLQRPAQSGKTGFDHLFPNAEVKVDPLFQKYLDTLGAEYFDTERDYKLFETQQGSNSDSVIINALNISSFTTPAEVRANIEFLATTVEGEKLLEIPEGEDETNFILGYMKDEKGKVHVLFIEHEFEDNVREIHFHIRPLDNWRNDNPKGLAASKKK